MDKFTFTLERDIHFRDDEAKTISYSYKSEQGANVEDLLREFMSFMKACDYSFHIDDYLDISTYNSKYTEVESQPSDSYSTPEIESAAYDDGANSNTSYTSDDELEWYIDESVTKIKEESVSEVVEPPSKIKQLRDTILPFLENLKKDPEKSMLRWPNREQIITDQIKKIEDIVGE